MNNDYLLGIRKTIVKAIQEATDIDTIEYWTAELKCIDEAIENWLDRVIA